ncbi:MAG TPA: acyl-CoA dehydrogenase family protein [Polyangiaceae bacterium]|nr:acyl-CoA dehydrogenase family protein [Polyangiaceae bacterium]
MKPVDAQSALATAARLCARFEETAVERDRAGGTAKAERDALRESGLLALSIPAEFGGAGATFSEVFAIVRLFARADPSLAHLFGFHHLLLATVRLFGRPAQWQQAYREAAAQQLFWGNALNPLDTGTRLFEEGDKLRLRGKKSFCSGALDSDRLIVSAHDANGKLLIGAIDSARPGLVFNADWDNIGQRQTDSGSVEFDDVVLLPSELLIEPGPLSSPFAALRPCIAQLSLANVYLGIAEGALGAAREYTQTQRRPWLTSGVASASEDPYVLHHYGRMWLELQAARLLADDAGQGLDAAWQQAEKLDDAGRGDAALRVAAAKAQATQVSLDVSVRIFDVMGARSTTRRAAMDRFFRNARTHTLHDPVDYKLKELGDWALNRKLPKPTFYS